MVVRPPAVNPAGSSAGIRLPSRPMEGTPRLSRAELGQLDRLACEEYGLPIAVLMENAGRSAAQEILRLRREQEAKGLGRVVVLVGPGNNGGDACVAIRHLSNAVSQSTPFPPKRREIAQGPLETPRSSCVASSSGWGSE